MASPDPVDCARLRLCPPASGSNRGDTNRCTIPRRCQPCRKGRNHLGETISPGKCRHNRLHLHLSLEIFPAMCLPSISHRDEIHLPTRMFFLINRRGPQIQIPLQSANVCPPISRKLPRRGKQSAPQDNSPSL